MIDRQINSKAVDFQFTPSSDLDHDECIDHPYLTSKAVDFHPPCCVHSIF